MDFNSIRKPHEVVAECHKPLSHAALCPHSSVSKHCDLPFVPAYHSRPRVTAEINVLPLKIVPFFHFSKIITKDFTKYLSSTILSPYLFITTRKYTIIPGSQQ